MDKQEITKYIGQHSAWKSKLKAAIASGSHSMDVGDVRRDDKCEFGKWLGTLPPAVRSSKEYQSVTSLHADFHRQAASVLQLVDSGKKHEATEAMGLTGPFTAATTKLTLQMSQWRDSI